MHHIVPKKLVPRSVIVADYCTNMWIDGISVWKLLEKMHPFKCLFCYGQNYVELSFFFFCFLYKSIYGSLRELRIDVWLLFTKYDNTKFSKRGRLAIRWLAGMGTSPSLVVHLFNSSHYASARLIRRDYLTLRPVFSSAQRSCVLLVCVSDGIPLFPRSASGFLRFSAFNAIEGAKNSRRRRLPR